MKKIVLLFLFCTLALCCYAQEGLKTGESYEVTSLYSGLSLPLFGFSGGLAARTNIFSHSAGNPALSNGSMLWEQQNWRLTKNAEYENKSIFDNDIGPYVLMIGGAVAMIVGPIITATSEGNDGYYTGVGIFGMGLGISIAGLVLLIVLN